MGTFEKEKLSKYTINKLLFFLNEKTREASVRVIREELERGSLIGAKCLMTHLGSAKDMSRDEALKITAAGIRAVMKGYKGSTQFLLEISAGAGNVIGDTFEELEQLNEYSNKALASK